MPISRDAELVAQQLDVALQISGTPSTSSIDFGMRRRVRVGADAAPGGRDQADQRRQVVARLSARRRRHHAERRLAHWGRTGVREGADARRSRLAHRRIATRAAEGESGVAGIASCRHRFTAVAPLDGMAAPDGQPLPSPSTVFPALARAGRFRPSPGHRTLWTSGRSAPRVDRCAIVGRSVPDRVAARRDAPLRLRRRR